MDIKKYYKDFDAEEVFEDKDEIEVLRSVFYLETGVIVFIDNFYEEGKKDINNQISEKDVVNIIDEDTEENVRKININKDRLLILEQEKGFKLTKENFGIGVEQQEEKAAL